jgi:SAM-dependent methyltransferase
VVRRPALVEASAAVPQNNFDERTARYYDETSADMFTPEVLDPAVAFLAQLAGNGAALEFAIGTGRVALPLSERGVQVHGLDISEPMVARLRAKPGADNIATTIGDFATTRVDGGPFRLVYLVFNSLMNLLTQEEQVATFRNAAAHLEPGGCFVIEIIVPILRRLPPGETRVIFDASPDHVGFDEYTDFVGQIESSHHFWNIGGRAELWSGAGRYVWPSELDLMAQLAGMRLRERWADWSRAPFTGESRSHVSVWEKPG